MPLGSLRHPFSDTVADIDGLSVRTRICSGASVSRTGRAVGRHGFTTHSLQSTMPSTAAQSCDDKLTLRSGFDVDGSRSSLMLQRQKAINAADIQQTHTAIADTGRRSSLGDHLTSYGILTEPPPSSSRTLCVIDCCCCCTGSILISWLKVGYLVI